MNEQSKAEPKSQLLVTEKKKGKEIATGNGRASWLHRVGDYYLVAWQQVDTDYTPHRYYEPTIQIISAEGTEVTQQRGQKEEIKLFDYLKKHFPEKIYFSSDINSAEKDTVTPKSIKSDYWRELFFKKNPKWRDNADGNFTKCQEIGILSLTYNSLPSSEIYGGKYLTSKKGETQYIIQVKNDAGVPLPKDRWVVYGPSVEPEDLPPDVKDWMSVAESGARYFSVAPGIDGMVGKNGLELFKAGDYTNPIFKDTSITDVESYFATIASVPPILVTIGHDQPNYIKTLQLESDPSKMIMRSVTLPPELRFPVVNGMTLDPSGAFMMLDLDKKIIVIALDTLEVVGEIPNASRPSFDSSGRFSVIKSKAVTFFDANFAELAHKREEARQAKIANNIRTEELFLTEGERKDREVKLGAQRLKPIVDQVSPDFERQSAQVKASRSREGIRQLEFALENLRSQLSVQMPGRTIDVNAIVELMQVQYVDPVRKEIYQQSVGEMVARLKTDLQTGLSLQAIGNLSQDYDEVKKMIPWLEEAQKTEIFEIGRDLQRKITEFLAAHSHEFIEQAKRYMDVARQKLETFSSRAEIESWVEFEYPSLLTQLGTLQRQCPQEAIDAIQAITQARIELGDLVAHYEAKFKREYAKIRELASEQNVAIGQSLSIEIKRFIERIQAKQFARRSEAENYVASSPTYRQINIDIEALLLKEPVKGKTIKQAFDVALSQFYYSVDQQSKIEVVQSGQQMVLLGNEAFPIWEGKVKKKQKKQVELQFSEDRTTHGPGVTRDQISGEIELKVTDEYGKVQIIKPYDGLGSGDDYRLGLVATIYGSEFTPSYLSGGEYKDFRRNYVDWMKGNDSLIRLELTARRNELRKLFESRPKRNQFGTGEQGSVAFAAAREKWDAQNKDNFSNLIQKYGVYLAEKNVTLLHRIDAIANEPEGTNGNGKGYVPEWQSHWVVDPQTESYLENMAEMLKMQLELQEGMLLLKGHAGTGKDVLVKMFCEKTHRPYFAIDCTKWTTEFELSEDITLESVDGASQTVKVPSVVLSAITTPGAVMYFNELNAMPEQAQIFLHSLLDEKRTLTLKTSSGKTIKADSSVLIMGSMNPGYPGTFEPQFATRSRTVSLEIGYPPLKRENDPGDNRADKPFNVSEALRIARGVSSLESMTYEVDLTRNEFVKAWDNYVNGIATGALPLSVEQKFDLEVILALVQFGDELRQNFIATFEKRGGRKSLEVSQPITAREMRRAAWALNQIPAAEKVNLAGAEDLAKQLIEDFFLSHIDDTEQRANLLRHIKANMHAKKRTAA